MTVSTDLLVVGLILTNIWFLASSRMRAFMQGVALQGVLLGLFPILVHAVDPTFRTFAFGFLTIGIKGVLFPWLFLRALRKVGINREVQPLVGYTTSILTGCFAFGIACWISSRLPLDSQPGLSPLVLPVVFLTLFVGLFLVVSRRSALSQTAGYLVFENGIYLFGVAFLGEVPLLVELGVLLDAFVALFVMGIAIHQIKSEFNHIDTVRMSSLRG